MRHPGAVFRADPLRLDETLVPLLRWLRERAAAVRERYDATHRLPSEGTLLKMADTLDMAADSLETTILSQAKQNLADRSGAVVIGERLVSACSVQKLLTMPGAAMKELAKAGFSQSYTYFTWRNTKEELTEYLTELTQTEMPDFFRGNRGDSSFSSQVRPGSRATRA